MKSAYELALEKLDAENGAPKPLTQEQKLARKGVEETFKTKLAERELFLEKKLDAAEAAGNYDEADKIRRQLTDERAIAEEEKEKEKEKIRNQNG